MNALIAMFNNGVGMHHFDTVMLVNRLAIGLFFAISGYHKLKDPTNLIVTLKQCHIPFPGIMCYWVAGVEFFGGLAVMAGLLAALASAGLIAILAVALCTDGPRRVKEYEPSDPADRLDDWLYLSETTYVVMLGFVLFFGPGKYALSALLP